MSISKTERAKEQQMSYTATITTYRAGSNKAEITTTTGHLEGDINNLRFAHQLSKQELPQGSTSTITVTEEN
jgi:hypothetical protein